jgi:hypothetical protein
MPTRRGNLRRTAKTQGEAKRKGEEVVVPSSTPRTASRPRRISGSGSGITSSARPRRHQPQPRETKRKREEAPVVAVMEEENSPKRRRPNRNWDGYFQLLVEYKEEHGNCNVSSRICINDAGFLRWIQNQRYDSSKLTKKQREKLQEIGFDWETDEQKKEHAWEEKFKRVKALVRGKKKGLASVSIKKKDPVLGAWLSKQRIQNSRGKLSLDRKEKLDSVRMSWAIRAGAKNTNAKDEEKWYEKYETLVEFHEDHGHCIVSCNYKDKPLGQWVARQRRDYVEERMRPDRQELLDDIDFVWKIDAADPEASLHQRQWNEMYKRLA